MKIMKLRLMQIILLIPCAIIDGVTLGMIHLPLWIICGLNPINHEPLLQWLFELKKEKL